MNTLRRRSLLLLALAGCLVVSGCDATSAVTKANYDKINTGMTEKEVTAILGAPTTESGMSASLPSAGIAGLDIQGGSVGSTTKTWKEGNNSIVVNFVNEKVFTKFWTGK
jgi:hypothetical protein